MQKTGSLHGFYDVDFMYACNIVYYNIEYVLVISEHERCFFKHDSAKDSTRIKLHTSSMLIRFRSIRGNLPLQVGRHANGRLHYRRTCAAGHNASLQGGYYFRFSFGDEALRCCIERRHSNLEIADRLRRAAGLTFITRAIGSEKYNQIGTVRSQD